MFGFLFKVVFIAVVVVGVGWYMSREQGIAKYNTAVQSSIDQLKTLDSQKIISNASSVLDSLVTHSDADSPVVLGVKITNDSLDTAINSIRSLPPDQVELVKKAICGNP